MKNFLLKLDKAVIDFSRRAYVPIARFAFFVIFFWFGFLKIVNLSPASDLVRNLFDATFLSAIIPFATFYILFGVFEMVIGLFFLFAKLDRVSFLLLLAHLAMTSMPLVLLPNEVWTATFAPTLEGQYIVKNIALLALALSLVARLKPLQERTSH